MTKDLPYPAHLGPVELGAFKLLMVLLISSMQRGTSAQQRVVIEIRRVFLFPFMSGGTGPPCVPQTGFAEGC